MEDSYRVVSNEDDRERILERQFRGKMQDYLHQNALLEEVVGQYHGFFRELLNSGPKITKSFMGVNIRDLRRLQGQFQQASRSYEQLAYTLTGIKELTNLAKAFIYSPKFLKERDVIEFLNSNGNGRLEELKECAENVSSLAREYGGLIQEKESESVPEEISKHLKKKVRSPRLAVA